MKPIFEAGPLISACKYTVQDRPVIEVLTSLLPITIPAAVYQEVVMAGSRYPDAAVARQQVEKGRITVETPQPNTDLSALLSLYRLGKGETEAIVLTAEKMVQETAVSLIVDDILAYVVCDRVKVNKLLFLDFLVMLTQEGAMREEEALDIVRNVQSRYPQPFVAHTVHMLTKG